MANLLVFQTVDIFGWIGWHSDILNTHLWTYLGKPLYVGPRIKEGVLLAFAYVTVFKHCSSFKKVSSITIKLWQTKNPNYLQNYIEIAIVCSVTFWILKNVLTASGFLRKYISLFWEKPKNKFLDNEVIFTLVTIVSLYALLVLNSDSRWRDGTT